MKIHQHAELVSASDDRPFTLEAVKIDRVELDIVRHRPCRPDLLDPPTAFRPAHRPQLGAEESANGVDFTLSHGAPLSAANPYDGIQLL